MSTAASAVIDYLMGTTFPTALSSYTDPDTASPPTIYFGPGTPKFQSLVTLQLHGVKFSEAWAELGPNYKYEEQAELPCTLTAWLAGQGNSDGFLQCKTECFSALSLISINVANDVRLGAPGLVRWMRLQVGQFMPALSNTPGALGHLDFTLEYHARVNSLDAGLNTF